VTVALGALVGLVILLVATVVIQRAGRRTLSVRQREELLLELRQSLNGNPAAVSRSHS
jgi:hypothetical protein